MAGNYLQGQNSFKKTRGKTKHFQPNYFRSLCIVSTLAIDKWFNMNKNICVTLINKHSYWGYDQNDLNYSLNISLVYNNICLFPMNYVKWYISAFLAPSRSTYLRYIKQDWYFVLIYILQGTQFMLENEWMAKKDNSCNHIN